MKLSIEVILTKIEKFRYAYEVTDFISSLDLTPEQIDFLVNHKTWHMRAGLAENPNIPEKIMIKLSNDEYMNVKCQLAKNPNIPDKIMIQLGSNKREGLRKALAQNPNLTEELMIKLSSDEEEEVRHWLAKNHNLTEKVIIRLNSDENENVRYEAFEKLKNLNSLKKEELEEAYDLIMESKYMKKEFIKYTFEYIAGEFPELSKLAKMFKKLIFKLKKDLK